MGCGEAYARTVTTAIRTLTGERDLAVCIVACLQTHRSRANWHPHQHQHLHLLVTDGGFRPNGTCVTSPAHATTRHGAVDGGVPPGRAAAVRATGTLRRCAGRRDADVAALRVPRALRRLGVRGRSRVCDAPRTALCPQPRRAEAAHLRPSRQSGNVPGGHVGGANAGHGDRGRARVPRPGAGPHPRPRARYDAVLWPVCQSPAWQAGDGGARRSERPARDGCRTTSGADRGHPPVGEDATAALLQRSVEVDPLVCPSCHVAMRVVAFITQASVIDQILTYLRTRAAPAASAAARSPPIDAGPREPRHFTHPRPSREAPTAP